MALNLIVPFHQGRVFDDSKVDIENGICFGLCIWFIETAEILSGNDFINYIKNFAMKPGKIMEIGLDYQKKSINRQSNATFLGKISQISLTHKSEKLAIAINSAYRELLDQTKPNMTFMLSIYGEKWGHATVLLKRNNQCQWFDPNMGLFSLIAADMLGEFIATLLSAYPSTSAARLNILTIN